MVRLAQRIALLMLNSQNQEELLSVIVRETRIAMEVEACSIFLEDQEGMLILVASDGVEHGMTRLQNIYADAGPVSQVIQARDVAADGIELEDMPSSPLFAVPIRRNGDVVGALVLHRADRGDLSAAEEALLLTISMQLATALRQIVTVKPITEQVATQAQQVRLSGVSGAPGIAIGSAVFPALRTELDQVADQQTTNPGVEEERFRKAVSDLLADLQAGQQRLADLLPGELRELFDVYAAIATDIDFIGGVVGRIRAGQWAPAAIRDSVTALGGSFASMEDERLKARAEDVRAVGRRLLLHLYRDPKVEFPERCVLVGSEVNLARMAEVPVEKLAGVVSFEGSTLSHTALLARSLGIPAVMGIGPLSREVFESGLLIVDGYQGRVFANPTASTLREFQRLEREDMELAEELCSAATAQSRTRCGIEIPVHVNIALLTDLEPALRAGAGGVGLYRTEFPFMLRDSLLDEQEQTGIYRQVLRAFAPAPVVIRTLDVGGDKPLSYLPSTEQNPFLGARGIRLSLAHPEVFDCQIRALLRAAVGLDNLRILLPMVSTVSEVVAARQLIMQTCARLAEAGVECFQPPIGVMIEVPSVLYQIGELAQYAEFFSIGSNDLTQYLMASSRENPQVAKLHDHFQPAVLRAIAAAVDAAHAAGCKVSVCGELASDPGGAALLIGIGVDELSVSVSALGRVKRVAASFSKAQLHGLVERVLRMSEVGDIRAELLATMEQAGLGGLVRAGR